ncbi:unnamed protein product [Hermetia illucens]|uniref:TIL domain-containing protein n=1 Tax=Hermetia illucens TaxID=343691 RepID=A0A7R8UV92_HERIL|nr:cysteine-rich venom protein 6-like [Hermetia illucens]CAD7087238.1 unnamed protein product [Hermetia illucens]
MKLLIAFILFMVTANLAPSHSASLPDGKITDCGENEIYKTCGVLGCQLNCDMIMNVSKCINFSLRCGTGCYCQDGFARTDNGRCVSIAECPKYVI